MLTQFLCGMEDELGKMQMVVDSSSFAFYKDLFKRKFLDTEEGARLLHVKGSNEVQWDLKQSNVVLEALRFNENVENLVDWKCYRGDSKSLSAYIYHNEAAHFLLQLHRDDFSSKCGLYTLLALFDLVVHIEVNVCGSGGAAFLPRNIRSQTFQVGFPEVPLFERGLKRLLAREISKSCFGELGEHQFQVHCSEKKFEMLQSVVLCSEGLRKFYDLSYPSPEPYLAFPDFFLELLCGMHLFIMKKPVKGYADAFGYEVDFSDNMVLTALKHKVILRDMIRILSIKEFLQEFSVLSVKSGSMKEEHVERILSEFDEMVRTLLMGKEEGMRSAFYSRAHASSSRGHGQFYDMLHRVWRHFELCTQDDIVASSDDVWGCASWLQLPQLEPSSILIDFVGDHEWGDADLEKGLLGHMVDFMAFGSLVKKMELENFGFDSYIEDEDHTAVMKQTIEVLRSLHSSKESEAHAFLATYYSFFESLPTFVVENKGTEELRQITRVVENKGIEELRQITRVVENKGTEELRQITREPPLFQVVLSGLLHEKMQEFAVALENFEENRMNPMGHLKYLLGSHLWVKMNFDSEIFELGGDVIKRMEVVRGEIAEHFKKYNVEIEGCRIASVLDGNTSRETIPERGGTPVQNRGSFNEPGGLPLPSFVSGSRERTPDADEQGLSQLHKAGDDLLHGRSSSLGLEENSLFVTPERKRKISFLGDLDNPDNPFLQPPDALPVPVSSLPVKEQLKKVPLATPVGKSLEHVSESESEDSTSGSVPLSQAKVSGFVKGGTGAEMAGAGRGKEAGAGRGKEAGAGRREEAGAARREEAGAGRRGEAGAGRRRRDEVENEGGVGGKKRSKK